MKVLGLDTSTLMTTCSVMDGDKLIGEYSLSHDMSHSEKLVPMIKEMMDSLGLKLEDIDLYAAAIGPGSFTGLRIGIATIKAFAHIYNKPVVGISTLEAMAYNLPYNPVVIPMINARRDRVYTGIYAWADEVLETILNPCIFEINELIEFIQSNYDRVLVNGDGAVVFKETLKTALGDKVIFSTPGLNMSKASSICELAIKKYNDGVSDDFFTLAPEYLLETQAQRELDERGK